MKKESLLLVLIIFVINNINGQINTTSGDFQCNCVSGPNGIDEIRNELIDNCFLSIPIFIEGHDPSLVEPNSGNTRSFSSIDDYANILISINGQVYDLDDDLELFADDFLSCGYSFKAIITKNATFCDPTTSHSRLIQAANSYEENFEYDYMFLAHIYEYNDGSNRGILFFRALTKLEDYDNLDCEIYSNGDMVSSQNTTQLICGGYSIDIVPRSIWGQDLQL